MVVGPFWNGVALAAAEAHRKVPEPTRTIALMALLGILLVGLLLIVATLLGAHWVRRQGGFRRGPIVPADVILPRNPPQSSPTINDQNVNPGDTFTGDDTVSNDDTVVS